MNKPIFTLLKSYLRWIILGGTLFFVVKAFKDNAAEVASITLEPHDWFLLAIALILSLFSHVWSGWVWTWILKFFQQPFGGWQAIRVYLITNMAKYLPGNVWHFYGRISAVAKAGGTLGVGSISVLLEPILLATAALMITLVSYGFGWIDNQGSLWILGAKIAFFIIVLLSIHPRVLNLFIKFLGKISPKFSNNQEIKIKKYPLFLLLGELGFILFKAGSFLLTLAVFSPVKLTLIPQMISIFSFSWLLGLIVPTPGGMGVFEATVISLVNPQQFPAGIIVTTVAVFRLISIIAESIGAGFAWLSQKKFRGNNSPTNMTKFRLSETGYDKK